MSFVNKMRTLTELRALGKQFPRAPPSATQTLPGCATPFYVSLRFNSKAWGPQATRRRRPAQAKKGPKHGMGTQLISQLFKCETIKKVCRSITYWPARSSQCLNYNYAFQAQPGPQISKKFETRIARPSSIELKRFNLNDRRRFIKIV